MPEEYDNLINPPEQASSTISKTLGQAALTLGVFIGGQALFMRGASVAKSKIFTSLSKHSSRFREAADYALGQGGSLTAFLSKNKSRLSPMASSLDRNINNATSRNIQSSWNKSSRIDKYRQFKQLSRGNQHQLYKTWGSNYLRETATFFPAFYAMDQMVGHGDAELGPESKERPAWYNIPGHIKGMAELAPMFVGIDVLARGGFKAAGAGLGLLAETLPKHISPVVQETLAKTANYFNSGRYLENELGGLPLKSYTAGLGAAKDAFMHALGSGRRRLFTQTHKNLSKYEKTPTPFRGLRKFYAEDFREKFDLRFKHRLATYKKRKQRADINSKDALYDSFDDFFHFFDSSTGANVYSQTIGKTGYAASGRALVHKSYYNESKKVPYLARLMDLRRVRSSDFKERKVIGDVYTQLRLDRGLADKIPGSSKIDSILSERSKDEFVNNLVSQKMFVHSKTGTLVDMSKLSPKHWTSKLLDSPLLTLGNTFSLANLFPFKVLGGDNMSVHRILPMKDFSAIHPVSQTPHMQKSPWIQQGTKSPVTHPNIYRFKKGHNTSAPGLMIRDVGEKNYNLFDYQGNDWEMIAKNLKPTLESDSPKMAKIFTRNQISTAQPEFDTKTMQTPSNNPLISWVQRNMSLLDDEGSYPSLLSRFRLFLPDKINTALDSRGGVPFSAYRATTTMRDLKGWLKTGKQSELSTTDQLTSTISRVENLGLKVSKSTFDDIISTDTYMEPVIEYLNNRKIISELNITAKKALSDDDQLLKIAASLRNKNPNIDVFNDSKAIDNILRSVRESGRGLESRAGPETPKQKVKRYIYEFAVHDSERALETAGEGFRPQQHIVEILKKRASTAYKEGRIGPTGLSRMEFGMFSDRLHYALRKATPTALMDDAGLEALGKKGFFTTAEANMDRNTLFLKEAKRELLDQPSMSGPGSILDEFTDTLGLMENTWANETGFNIGDLAAATVQVREANPWVAYPADWKAGFGLGAGWAAETVNRLVSWTGLGWSPDKYSTLSGVSRLWGRRAAAFTGATLAYSAADTTTDVSGLFDWTFLDEGITVGVADQMAKARLASGFVYDKMGVDNAARYMEGLMPGSSKIIPGAAMGFMMGGIKGSLIGGLANAYLQPQLSEGPLSFMSVIPPLAPFVSDMTKDFSELQGIYEGTELVPHRKGRGWSLGLTPISGGRISRYEPGWYPRLKSQYKASPVLYGSKLEQFLAKDVPFVDFSLMDIVDPHYLEKKQAGDRPFPVVSTPFSEFPVAGPILGATVGRLYNALHPMALGGSVFEQKTRSEYMKGTAFNWKGESLGTHGPQYRGYMGEFFGPNNLPGNPDQTRKYAVMSPNNMQPLISEQIYRGWIEPLGLPGFITSAALWGGDEPFTHIPVAQSSGTLDSFSRTYWDQGIGDLVGSTELLRRAVPRPRTSYEQVNPLNNNMPGWMPDDFQRGDPYCLTPDTMVETSKGLKEAGSIKEGDFVRTLNGRYYPVNAIKTRPVEEEIYNIIIKGIEDWPIKVTGGHPFYINGDWKFASDLSVEDKVSYPLLNIKMPNAFHIADKEIKVTGALSNFIGLLARWTTSTDIFEFRPETTDDMKQEITDHHAMLFATDLMLKDSELEQICTNIQTEGPPLYFLNKGLGILANYINAFMVESECTTNKLVFRFHSSNSAYAVWSALLQYRISSRIEGTAIILEDLSVAELGYVLGVDVTPTIGAKSIVTFEGAIENVKHAPLACLPIHSIEKEKYKGLVYAFDMGEEDTFVVPGCAVHNSKIGRGELLLPGQSYESFFNPNITFPTGASRLGQTPYDQALHMIGLGEQVLGDQEDILETGSAIHAMVQDQLVQAGLATKAEALISDAEHSIRSYADLVYRDPRTGQEQPLEIKSISGAGLTKLKQPKWKHKVQLNAYMAMMGTTQGRFLYVSREDPAQNRDFTMRFNPALWETTLTRLEDARQMAGEFLDLGYGNAQAGYSYIDRLQVLLNSSPFSREYRETEKLVTQQLNKSLLTPSEEDQLKSTAILP